MPVVVVIAAIVSIVVAVAVFKWKHHQQANRTIREETAGIYEPVDLIPPRLPLRTHSITLHDCPAYFKVETSDCIAYSVGLNRSFHQPDGIEVIHETSESDRTYESIDDAGLVAMDDMHLQVPEQASQTHSLSATLPTSSTYGNVTKFADHLSV